MRQRAFERAPGRHTARSLQPFVVQLRQPELRALERLGAVGNIEGFGYALLPTYTHLYHDHFGLLLEEEAVADPTALMC